MSHHIDTVLSTLRRLLTYPVWLDPLATARASDAEEMRKIIDELSR